MKTLSQVFPTIEELSRVEALRKYELLNQNQQQSVLGIHDILKNQFKKGQDVIYISHAIPSRISEFYSDFVQGDSDLMSITGSETNEEHKKLVEQIVDNNELKEMIGDIAYNQSEFGYDILLGRVEEGEYIIEQVPADQYFPQKDGSVIFLTYKKIDSGIFKASMYAHVQSYKMEGKNVLIERAGYSADAKGIMQDKMDYIQFKQVFGLLDDRAETETIMNLGELPIEQIDNGKRTKLGYGKSDYSDILPQLAEINERVSHISIQLLKNLDAKLILPSGLTNPQDEDKNFIVNDAYVIPDDIKSEVKYVNNTNPLLDDAQTHIKNLFSTISFITSVPMFELLGSGNPERVESLKIRLFSAVRKTHAKRTKIKRAIMSMFRIGMIMLGKENLAMEPVTIRFSDVIPTDDLTVVNVESEKVINGLSSRRSSIMRLNNVDSDTADKELERIKEEDAMNGFGQPSTPIAPPQI